MGLQIVCVERKGPSPAHRHITAVGIDTPQVVIRFSVKTVRRVIKRQTMEFYCLDGEGKPLVVRRFRCHCGAKSIRIGDDDIADGVLSALPTCSSRADRAGGALGAKGTPLPAIGLAVRSAGAPRPDGPEAAEPQETAGGR